MRTIYSRPTKLQETVNKVLNNYIKSRYNFDTESRHSISQQIIQIVEQHYNISHKHNPARKLGVKWFASRPIRGSLEEHSVGSFVDWLSKQYFIIAIPSKKFYSKILFKFLRLFL